MKKLILAALLGLLATGVVAQTYFAAGATQRLTYGCLTTCAQQTSTAFGTQTRYVRVVAANATAYISFAASGATLLVTQATGIFLPVNVPEIFRVPASGRLGIIAHSTTGVLSITELTQ